MSIDHRLVTRTAILSATAASAGDAAADLAGALRETIAGCEDITPGAVRTGGAAVFVEVTFAAPAALAACEAEEIAALLADLSATQVKVVGLAMTSTAARERMVVLAARAR